MAFNKPISFIFETLRMQKKIIFFKFNTLPIIPARRFSARNALSYSPRSSQCISQHRRVGWQSLHILSRGYPGISQHRRVGWQSLHILSRGYPGISQHRRVGWQSLHILSRGYPGISPHKPAARVYAEWLLNAGSKRLFHTTSPKRAVPPFLWVLLRPFANVAAVVFGRAFRKMWQKLPQERRTAIINRLKQKKKQILGVMGALFFGLSLYVLAHVEEEPYTKRRRFILFSRQDMRILCEDVQNEILGLYENAILPSNHPLYRSIQRVMIKLMNANREDIVNSGVASWTIYVINAPEINNAMVLPNGTVFIFSGIMDTCSSDDQLGAVLAHEIAHVLLNHQGETFSKQHFVSLFSVFIITTLWAVLPDLAAFLSQIFVAQTTSFFIHLPFSRLMESEADAVGLNLAAKACFDVREASVFWAKMALREELGCEEKPLELLSSHPSHETRQKAIDDLIPEALKLRDLCKCRSLSSRDPRMMFSRHKMYLKDAKEKGCLSCQSIFSSYAV